MSTSQQIKATQTGDLPTTRKDLTKIIQVAQSGSRQSTDTTNPEVNETTKKESIENVRKM